jgi:transposase
MKNNGPKGSTVEPVKKYSESFKRVVVKEYEKGLLNKDQIQVK